jgi:hypothetical protein
LTLARQIQVVVLSSKRRKDCTIIGKSGPIRHTGCGDHFPAARLRFINHFVACWFFRHLFRRNSSTSTQGGFMPRKKNAAQEAAPTQTSATAVAVAEPETKAPQSPMGRPAYIDGPPVDEEGKVISQANPEAKNWGDPYKALVTTAAFEMGENRRFRQRVFLFKEKPSDEVLAALKDNGFSYRAAEKAWTIQANPDTRKLSDELAEQFAGSSQALSR